MKRRKFLGAAIIGATATGLAAPAVAQTTTLIRLGSIWNADNSARGGAPARFAARVNAISAGRIKVEVAADGEFSDPGRLFDSVSDGSIEMYFGKEEIWRGRHPAFPLFTSVPGGMNADEVEAFVHYGDGQYLWDTLSAEFGIKPFLGGDLGPCAIWSRDPIDSVAALTSKRVSTAGLGVSALKALGVGDIAEMFADGTIPPGTRVDAFEGLSAAEVMAEGLQSTHKHMTHPGFNRPSTTLSYGLNLNTYTQLSDVDKNLISFCCAAEHADMRARALIANTTAINTLRESGAVVEHDAPDDLWEAQVPSREEIFADIEAHDFAAADIVGAYRYFLEDVSVWSAIGKTSYSLARNRSLGALL